MLISLQAYIAGSTLYHSIFTEYGPFYFEAMRLLFALPSVTVGHDAGRIITLIFWIAAPLALGVASLIATKRLVYGLATQLVAFTVLFVMPNEPMHPGGLIAILLSVLVLVVSGIENEMASRRFVAAGAIVGGLMLIKINVGLLALSAFVLTGVYFVHPFCRFASLKMIVSACFVGMSFILMAKHLDQSVVRFYASHVALASLCCVTGLPTTDRSGVSSIPVLSKSRTSARATCFTSGFKGRLGDPSCLDLPASAQRSPYMAPPPRCAAVAEEWPCARSASAPRPWAGCRAARASRGPSAARTRDCAARMRVPPRWAGAHSDRPRGSAG